MSSEADLLLSVAVLVLHVLVRRLEMAGSLAAPQVPQRHDAQFHLGCRCSILHVSLMGSLARHLFERK